MSKEIRDIFTDIGIAAVVLVIALPLLYKGGCEPKSEPKNDTIYIHDTIRIVEPTHIKETIVRHDTIFFPIYNELDSSSNLTSNLTSNLVQDSVEVVIPITERTYEDSTYKAVVRGYNPELVSLDIYNTTKYYPVVERVKVKPKVVVGIGPYAGFGNKGFNYGIAVNVSMPILSW